MRHGIGEALPAREWRDGGCANALVAPRGAQLVQQPLLGVLQAVQPFRRYVHGRISVTGYCAVQPPSTTSEVPVTSAEASLAR